jgi:hypothetical protein
LPIGSDARNVTPQAEQASRNGWNLGTIKHGPDFLRRDE